MFKNKQRTKLFIVSVVAIIGNFISSYYFSTLFYRYFFIFLWIYVAFFVLLLVCAVKSFIFLKGHHRDPKDFIVTSMIVLYFGFCLWGGQEKLKFKLHENERYEFVKMIQENEIDVNSETGEIILDHNYKDISQDSEAIVLIKNKKRIAIGFWDDKGFLDSGFSMYVYVSDDNEKGIQNVILEKWPYYEQYEINIERLKRKWFYVAVAEKRL